MTTTASAAEQHFRSAAPKFMHMFMEDFDASDLDAAAVFGDAGYESLGFTELQEMTPTVDGSRGGWGWFQWTGPRRVAFEAYCKRNNLDPASDEANYKFLFELIGSEKGAIAKLKAAKTLEAKVKAFEAAFERAGVKAYDKRIKWAQVALDALSTSRVPVPPPIEEHEKPLAPPATKTRPSWIGIAIIAALSLAVGVCVWLFGQAATGDEISLIGDIPDPRLGLFGGDGGSTLAGEIALQVALAFVAPLVSAAATAVVDWITFLWQRNLKADFDAKSADALHQALERGMLAAIDAFGGIRDHFESRIVEWVLGAAILNYGLRLVSYVR